MSLAFPQPADEDIEPPVHAVQGFQARTVPSRPNLSEVETTQRDYERGLLSIHAFLMGGVPIDLYEPWHREEIQSELALASAKPVLDVKMSSVDLKRELRLSLFAWYLAWLDCDPKEYSARDYERGLRPTLEQRKVRFAGYNKTTKKGPQRKPGNIAQALPFPEWISSDPALLESLTTRERFREGFTPFDNPDKSGTNFEKLYEKTLRFSFTIPADRQSAEFPFSSLRDFILSMLPDDIPMKRPTLGYRSSLPRYKHDLYSNDEPEELHYHPIQVLAHEDPDLVVRLVKHFGADTQGILSLLNGFEPVESLDKKGFAKIESMGEWPDAVREVEQVRHRLGAILPGVLAHLKGDPDVGAPVVEDLRSMPPFERHELDDWGRLNGLSDEEVDELYRFVTGEYPKDIGLLEDVVSRFIFSGASFVDSSSSSPIKPVLITEKGQLLDPWTKNIISKLKRFSRGSQQILTYEAENRHQELASKALKLIKGEDSMQRGGKGFAELAKICSELAKEPDQELSFSFFQELISNVWGDLEGLRSYVSGLVESKRTGSPIQKEDRRFSILMAIQRGFLDTAWRCAGNGAERVQQVDLQVSTQIASDLQTFVCSHVNSTGLAPEDPDIHYLAVSNDLMLLVLTEAHYYSGDTTKLKKAIENHKICVGTSSSHPLAKEIKQNPTFLYSAAKYAYLLGRHEASLTFVEAVTELDSFVGYYLDFLTRLNSIKDADMRPDKLGLNGFAPIMVRESRFIQELARIGFLALREVPETDQNADRIQKMHTLFGRVQGKLTPSQALNSHLTQAQEARDQNKDRLADHYIEQAWLSIGDQNGYQARRIEHNMAEIEVARLDKQKSSPETCDDSGQQIHVRSGKILVMERNLHLEERQSEGGAQNPIRVWEYDASYLQALIRFAGNRLPEAGLPTVERRKKGAFTFEDFNERPMQEWIRESSQLAQESLKVLAKKSPGNAEWAGKQILEWLKTNLPLAQDPEIQKLPILAEWEALVNELKQKKA